MPFAGFKDFDDCVKHMMEKEGYDKETAEKVCGKLQAIHERSVELSSNRQDVDGGYLIKDVKLVAVGVWNGIDYTATELAKGANKWRDNSVWNRHYEGKQRDETNRIGLIRNQRFDDDSVVGDIFLSDETPEGREMIEAVRTDQINGISVEHVDVQVGNLSTNISFLGAAVVPDPACSVCQLSKNKEEFKVEEKDFEKLQDTVAELAKKVEALTKVDVDNVVKEQSRKDAKVIEGLEKRIKELEDEPVTNLSNQSDLVDATAGMVFEHGETYRRL